MKWTSEKLDLLRKLLAEGHSTRKCAEIIGESYNSVEHVMRNYNLHSSFKQVSKESPEGLQSFLEGKLKPEQKQELLDTLSPAIVEQLKKNILQDKPYVYKHIGSREEEAVLVLSDMHTGMVNEIYDPNTQNRIITFNEKIRQQELVYLRDSVFEIYDILSKSYKLKKLHILILGDMITNDRIFEGQQFEIDRPYGTQVWDTLRDLTNFINFMKNKFESVHVVGCVGNHGRSNAKYMEEPVENNFEWTLYKMLQEAFKQDKAVSVEVPSTRFYSIKIFNHTYYMSHGDNFRGFSKGALDRAVRDLLTTLMPDLPTGFDVYIMGHLHSAEKMDLNEKSTLIVNGSWIPRDQYGYKMFRRYSKPQQWFFGVSKSRPITWSYALDLKGIHKKGI